MEFIQLSAGGKEMLAGVIGELARLQAIMNELRSVRREMDAESYKKQLAEGKLQAAILCERIPLLRAVLQAENSAPDETAVTGEPRKVEANPPAVPVDLFG